MNLHPSTIARILIVVATRDRRSLTGLTLDSIARNKSPSSGVVILDDASTEYDVAWLNRWGFIVERRDQPVGVGLAARARIERFLNSPPEFEYLCTLDNDVLVVRNFDTMARALWAWIKGDGITLLSGYRSNTYRTLVNHGEWLEVDHIGGPFQFMDRPTATKLLDIPLNEWSHTWDYNVARACTRRIVPVGSFAFHLGNHGVGTNSDSWDRAVGFDAGGIW